MDLPNFLSNPVAFLVKMSILTVGSLEVVDNTKAKEEDIGTNTTRAWARKVEKTHLISLTTTSALLSMSRVTALYFEVTIAKLKLVLATLSPIC